MVTSAAGTESAGREGGGRVHLDSQGGDRAAAPEASEGGPNAGSKGRQDPAAASSRRPCPGRSYQTGF